MKHVHAYTPRNSVPETTIKIANLATYNASNLKTKQPKLTKSIKIENRLKRQKKKNKQNERDIRLDPLPQTENSFRAFNLTVPLCQSNQD